MTEPKQMKGGTFAPADTKLIKKLLLAHFNPSNESLTPEEEKQAMNLLHRLDRIL